MAEKTLEVLYHTHNSCVVQKKNLSDWYDFADWVKQLNEAGVTVCIVVWNYTEREIEHGCFKNSTVRDTRHGP